MSASSQLEEIRLAKGCNEPASRRKLSLLKKPQLSLRARLVLTVFTAVCPVWLFMYFTELPWMGFGIGFLALIVAWLGGERFILRQVMQLYDATRNLVKGDLSSRTGLEDMPGELGELARNFDQMAATLQQRAKESEETSYALLGRALQQTVVAALGQFALVSNDLKSLLQQATALVAQTLEVEFCDVLEIQPGNEKLRLESGVGWREGCIGRAEADMDYFSHCGYVLSSGEPVVVDDINEERRFMPNPLLVEHEVSSSVSVVIAMRQRPFGVLEVHTARKRKFTDAEAHFLFSVATIIGNAIERHRTETELRKLAAFAQLNPNPALEFNLGGEITYFNDAALKLALSVKRSHPRDIVPESILGQISECTSSAKNVQFQTKFERRTLNWSLHPVAENTAVHCYIEDVTDRLSLEAQLLQSQKMESIGQLAAGVAHDFNNMLTIIQGHAGLLMARPDLARAMHDSAQAVYFASERAAGLTRQLLMFSRKNVVQLSQLDLREVVTNLTKMLKRLLGETVTLEFDPPLQLPIVRADAGMIEQVVMNLAVNARDAMLSIKRDGVLTISLSCVEIGETYIRQHPEARPGEFVCLRVSDVGCGMDQATLSRIFEPFFTTKEMGKGTGLGLATVYGIVKQHKGWVEVSSRVGKGTSFNVFLPVAAESQPKTGDRSDQTMPIVGGDETIMVVEDEPVLRDLVQLILEEAGYRVYAAGSGPEALDVWARHGDAIELLITDMVMPHGMSGVELAEQLLKRSPDLRLIFTSGYTVDDISTAFLRKHNNARFLQKPYARTTLAHEVRNILDSLKIQQTPIMA